MRKILRIAGLSLLAVLVVIQFFQPDRNKPETGQEADLISTRQVPEEVAAILEKSCYDCHSNRTEYPWYSYISPVSWFLESHIRKGREEMDLSAFGLLEKNRMIGVLTKICEEIEDGSMPLKSYLLMHRKARLTESEVERICTWSEEEALRVMLE